MTKRYKQNKLLTQMAQDVQLADHAYQLAVASGNLEKIRQAKQFFNICFKEYDAEKKRSFSKQYR